MNHDIKEDPNRTFICDCCGEVQKATWVNGKLYTVNGMHLGTSGENLPKPKRIAALELVSVNDDGSFTARLNDTDNPQEKSWTKRQ